MASATKPTSLNLEVDVLKRFKALVKSEGKTVSSDVRVYMNQRVTEAERQAA